MVGPLAASALNDRHRRDRGTDHDHARVARPRPTTCQPGARMEADMGAVVLRAAVRTAPVFPPLFLVQSAIAGSVGVTAIAASIAFGVRLLRFERTALVALMVGFALLAVSAGAGHATALGSPAQWVLLAGVVVVLIVGALSARL